MTHCYPCHGRGKSPNFPDKKCGICGGKGHNPKNICAHCLKPLKWWQLKQTRSGHGWMPSRLLHVRCWQEDDRLCHMDGGHHFDNIRLAFLEFQTHKWFDYYNRGERRPDFQQIWMRNNTEMEATE